MLKYSKMTLFTPQAYRRWFEKFLAIIVIFDTTPLKNESANDQLLNFQEHFFLNIFLVCHSSQFQMLN